MSQAPNEKRWSVSSGRRRPGPHTALIAAAVSAAPPRAHGGADVESSSRASSSRPGGENDEWTVATDPDLMPKILSELKCDKMPLSRPPSHVMRLDRHLKRELRTARRGACQGTFWVRCAAHLGRRLKDLCLKDITCVLNNINLAAAPGGNNTFAVRLLICFTVQFRWAARAARLMPPNRRGAVGFSTNTWKHAKHRLVHECGRLWNENKVGLNSRGQSAAFSKS